MKDIDACEAVYINGYEQGAKDYKEQRDLLLQENAELFGKIEQLEEAVGRMVIELSAVKKERDAAVADIEKYCCYCIVCKNADFTNDYTHNRCRKCLDEDNRYFEWRGVQEDEHETD